MKKIQLAERKEELQVRHEITLIKVCLYSFIIY